MRFSGSTRTCDPAGAWNRVGLPSTLALTIDRHLHRIKVHFKDSKGDLIKTIEGNEGDDVLSLAHEHDIDLEGACEGSIACSTCHVILSPEHYDMLEEPGDDENDMLDMAFGLTDTSRLGCQVKLEKKLDGVVCTLPAATRNMFVDGEFVVSPGPSPPLITCLSRKKAHTSLISSHCEHSSFPALHLELQYMPQYQGYILLDVSYKET